MKRRIPHLLKSNKSTKNPAQFLFFDTETLEVPITSSRKYHKLKLGWSLNWIRANKSRKEVKTWKYFETPEVFWKFLISRVHSKETLYVIAHNMIFDFTVLEGFKYLPLHGYELMDLFEKGRVFIAIYRKDSKKIVFLDNLNFFKTSLKKIGYSMGLKKKSIDFNTASKDELSKYCKRDVEILLTLWKKWINFRIENNLGNFGVTVAGQALKTYRHRFMREKIYIHNQLKTSEFERESYYGGRVECFRIGSFTDEYFYNLDVNSMFPSVMINNLYPVKLDTYFENITVEKLENLSKKYLLIADVFLNTDKRYYPKREEYGLIFPVGEFRTTLCSPELNLALKNNHIKSVERVFLYEGKNIFYDYVKYFYIKKREADQANNKADRLFFKYLLNTLYGKFGQKGGQWVKVGRNLPDLIYMIEEFDRQTGEHYWLRSINGLVQKRVKEGESFHSFPAISAFVTSYARVKLIDLIEKAGFDNVYYMDTDCLFVNQEGYDNLESEIKEGQLGKLKLAGVSDNLIIFGNKDYQFGDIKKCKGISFNAVQVDDTTYYQQYWGTLRSIMRQEDKNKYIVKTVIKKLEREYKKGRVSESGKVKPFTFPLSEPSLF